MTLAEELVFLGGTHINHRFQIGRAELLSCENAIDINDQIIRDFIGSLTPTTVQVKRGNKVIHVKSVQIDHQLVTWEEQA